jgi:hypothetical protein
MWPGASWVVGEVWLGVPARCLVVALALLMAGSPALSAQDDANDPTGLTPPTENAELPDAADLSPKNLIGSRWPAKPEDDARASFAAVKNTDRLGEAMREAQAAQEAAARTAAADAAAEARNAEALAAREARRLGRHGKGKRFAGRTRAGSGVATASTGRTVASKAARQKSGKAAVRSASAKKQISKSKATSRRGYRA